MSKIGVIFCARNMAEYLEMSLSPWVRAREERLGGHTYLIAAVCVPFEGFDCGEEDGTANLLRESFVKKEIDNLITGNTPMKETEARGECLRWLVGGKVDYLIQWDADEKPTQVDIAGMIRFAEANPFVTMFRIAYRNLVFSTSQYLEEPFTPPRIHRVWAGSLRAHSFWDDNNVMYGGTITRNLKRDTEFASVTIPQAFCNPLHYSWLNDLRSKKKVEYQTIARKWECSFAWDDSRGGLIFNEEYYKTRGIPLPTVLSV